MRKILGPAMSILFACHGQAATIEAFGLVGRWSSNCATAAPGFSIIIAELPGAAPTYTTISAEGGIRTTIRSAVLDASAVDARRFRLRLRISGGDRNGGPLPSPTTNTFEQVIERLDGKHIWLLGAAAQPLERCGG